MTTDEAIAELAVSMAKMADAVTSIVTCINELLAFRSFTGNFSSNHQRFTIEQDLIARGYTEQEAKDQVAEWMKDPTQEAVLTIVPASKASQTEVKP